MKKSFICCILRKVWSSHSFVAYFWKYIFHFELRTWWNKLELQIVLYSVLKVMHVKLIIRNIWNVCDENGRIKLPNLHDKGSPKISFNNKINLGGIKWAYFADCDYNNYVNIHNCLPHIFTSQSPHWFLWLHRNAGSILMPKI